MGKKDHWDKVLLASHHIKVTCYQYERSQWILTYHVAKVTVKLHFFFLFIIYSLIRNLYEQVGTGCSIFWREVYLHKLFWFLLYEDLPILPTVCIYSIIYLYQYELIGIYFYLGYSSVLYYLFCCSNYSRFVIKNSSVAFLWHISLVSFLSTSLISGTPEVTGLSYTFPVPDL